MGDELDGKIGRLAGQLEMLGPILIRMEERAAAYQNRLAALEEAHKQADRQGHAIHKSFHIRLDQGSAEFRHLALEMQKVQADLKTIGDYCGREFAGILKYIQTKQAESETIKKETITKAANDAAARLALQKTKKWEIRKALIVAALGLGGAVGGKLLEKLFHSLNWF